MLRIGICDDDVSARDLLHATLDRELDEQTEQIVYEFSGGTSAVKWLVSHPGEIDLLFLDVEMPGQNGVETARAIRRFDREIMLVFLTGYRDYIFDGYQVEALDFILKPLDHEQAKRILGRVRTRLSEREHQHFVFKNTDGTYRLPLSQIQYFYSERRLVTLVAGDGREYPFYARLNALAGQLAADFVRIHQRYLVNPQYVSHYRPDRVEIGTVSLPISRALKAQAGRELAQHLLRE